MRITSLTVLALTAALAGCNLHGRPAIERKERPISRSGQVATESVDASTVVSPGIVEPWDAQIDLSSQESGRIAQILIKEGDTVEKGQVLAVLDDAVQRNGVELARADVAEARAALVRIQRGATVEELQQAQADCDAAAAQAEFARAAESRSAGLHKEGVVSDDAFDRAAAEARTQSALSQRAASRLAEMKRGPRIEDRQAAEARLLAATARLEASETALARRSVVAASAGTVLLSRLHAGEFYNPGAGSLFILGDMTRLQVRLEVDEIDAGIPVPGAACAIYNDSGVRLAQGTIIRLAPKLGRRALPLESPTARADVRVREVFVQVPVSSKLIPNQRVWGHTTITTRTERPAGSRP